MAYILVIDDDEDFVKAVQMVLSGDGHEVGAVFDTESAVTSMEQRRPDLVVLDVMFPENSDAGFDLARTMRHDNEQLKNVPILMLTAVNMKFPLGFSASDIDDYWLPVADFVEKPVDFDVLRARVTKLLEEAGSDTADERKE